MSRPRRQTPPPYRLHKPSGQAVVTLNGRDFYLERHSTKVGLSACDRLIGEWLANGRCLPHMGQDPPDMVINELRSAYLRRKGVPSCEWTADERVRQHR